MNANSPITGGEKVKLGKITGGNLAKSEPMICPSCGGSHFSEVSILPIDQAFSDAKGLTWHPKARTRNL